MQLNDSNKVPLDYIFLNILSTIYKISLNDNNIKNRHLTSTLEWRKYNIS